jgi:hypothetical protein
MSRRSKGALFATAGQQGAATAVAIPEFGAGQRVCHHVRGLDTPGMSTRRLVYSKMNARWHCWWLDDSGSTLVRVDSSSSWSVLSWNGLPSKRKQKFLIPETATSSCQKFSN